MTRVTIAYTKRTCKTGRALFEKLKESGRFSRVRRVFEDKRVKPCDALIRWGNSVCKIDFTPSIELNSASSVHNTSDKNLMMTLLESNNSVETPLIYRSGGNLEDYRDSEGGFYVRGKNQSVRYDTEFKPGDNYVSKTIENKEKEYRVHVFKGRVINIYEKVPNGEDVKLCKSHNCHFRKLNIEMATNATRSCNAGAQFMALEAVRALGLDFGGVDMIMDSDCNFYVNEVNTGIGLNTPNLELWTNRFIGAIFGEDQEYEAPEPEESSESFSQPSSDVFRPEPDRMVRLSKNRLKTELRRLGMDYDEFMQRVRVQ